MVARFIVIGDENTRRALRKVQLKVKDLEHAWSRIGAEIKKDAIPLTPVLTGALVNSIRAGKTKTQATVRAGGKNLPYAGPLNYGGTVSGYYGPHNIGPVHFLNKALDKNEDFANDEVESEIGRIISRAGL